MTTEGTPFRDRYASEARAAAARAHAPPVEEPPTPVPRRVNSPEPRKAAPTPTPPSKLLQRYLASEATKIPEAPGALEAASVRMADRSDGAYESNPTATLATWRNFWDSRRPYLERIGASSVLPDFCISILDRAGANDMDVTRVQEVLRYNDG